MPDRPGPPGIPGINNPIVESTQFGLRLRTLREARGISLEHIARVTKVGLGRLETLERGNLTGWPAGVFARGFVRAYAEAIGASADPLVEEFRQLCPESGASRGKNAAGRLRLVLIEESRWARTTDWLGRRLGSRHDRRQPAHHAIGPARTSLRIV